MAGETGTQASVAPKAKVFLSYSRRDESFALWLRSALESQGIDVFRDLDDTLPGEEWWARLQGLITACDTVVFLLSPQSVASKVCRDEVSFAESLRKRILPAVIDKVDWAQVPTGLAARHSVFFDHSAERESQLEKLVSALALDIDWIREHTRLHERASIWSEHGRPKADLLGGKALYLAERWLSDQPASAEPPTPLHREYITASREWARRSRALLTASLGAGMAVALALAGVAAFQWRQAADKGREAAQSSVDAQMRLALLHSERNSTNEAITTALAAMKLAGSIGYSAEEHERVLYQVASQAEKGSFIAGQIEWPKSLPQLDVRELHFTDSGSAVCAVATYSALDREYSTEFCFSIGERLQNEPALQLGGARRRTEMEPLDAKLVGDRVQITKEGTPRPVYSLRANQLGDHLPTSNLSAWRCTSGRFLLLQVIRSKPIQPNVPLAKSDRRQKAKTAQQKPPEQVEPEHIGIDEYLLEPASGKLTKLSTTIGTDSLACSPFGPYIVGSPRQGQVSIYNAEQHEIVAATSDDVARDAGNADRISFSRNGLALAPSFTMVNGRHTPAFIAALDQSAWSEEKIELPEWRRKTAQLGAISVDGKRVALLYDNDTLVVWDVASLGMLAKVDPPDDQNNESNDQNAEKQRQAAAVATVKQLKSKYGSRMSCFWLDPKTNKLLATGPTTLLMYDIVKGETVLELNGKLVNSPENSCEASLDSVSELSGSLTNPAPGIHAFCLFETTNRTDCYFFLDEAPSSPSWIDTAILAKGCAVIRQTSALWLCAQGSDKASGQGNDKNRRPAIAILNWSARSMRVVSDAYFALIFEHQYGLADFDLQDNDKCQRVMLGYTNWQRGGGAPQPDGTIIFDLLSGRVVAHARTRKQPILCDVHELVSHIRSLEQRYQETVITLDPDYRAPDELNDVAWGMLKGVVLKGGNREQLDDALRIAQKAVAMRPTDIHFLDTRGQIYLQLGRIDEAFADLDLAIKNGADDAGTFYARGLVFERRGERTKAMADFLQAIKASRIDDEWDKHAQTQARRKSGSLESDVKR